MMFSSSFYLSPDGHIYDYACVGETGATADLRRALHGMGKVVEQRSMDRKRVARRLV